MLTTVILTIVILYIVISNNPKMPQRNVNAHGSNLTAITGSIGDHSRLHAPVRGHGARVDWRKISRREEGLQLTAGIFTHVPQPLLRTATANKALRLINGIFPDFAIDARGARFSELLQFTGSSRLDGVEAFWLTSRAWESASHQTTLPSTPNKGSLRPLTAGQ